MSDNDVQDTVSEVERNIKCFNIEHDYCVSNIIKLGIRKTNEFDDTSCSETLTDSEEEDFVREMNSSTSRDENWSNDEKEILVDRLLTKVEKINLQNFERVKGCTSSNKNIPISDPVICSDHSEDSGHEDESVKCSTVKDTTKLDLLKRFVLGENRANEENITLPLVKSTSEKDLTKDELNKPVTSLNVGESPKEVTNEKGQDSDGEKNQTEIIHVRNSRDDSSISASENIKLNDIESSEIRQANTSSDLYSEKPSNTDQNEAQSFTPSVQLSVNQKTQEEVSETEEPCINESLTPLVQLPVNQKPQENICETEESHMDEDVRFTSSVQLSVNEEEKLRNLKEKHLKTEQGEEIILKEQEDSSANKSSDDQSEAMDIQDKVEAITSEAVCINSTTETSSHEKEICMEVNKEPDKNKSVKRKAEDLLEVNKEANKSKTINTKADEDLVMEINEDSDKNKSVEKNVDITWEINEEAGERKNVQKSVDISMEVSEDTNKNKEEEILMEENEEAEGNKDIETLDEETKDDNVFVIVTSPSESENSDHEIEKPPDNDDMEVEDISSNDQDVLQDNRTNIELPPLQRIPAVRISSTNTSADTNSLNNQINFINIDQLYDILKVILPNDWTVSHFPNKGVIINKISFCLDMRPTNDISISMTNTAQFNIFVRGKRLNSNHELLAGLRNIRVHDILNIMTLLDNWEVCKGITMVGKVNKLLSQIYPKDLSEDNTYRSKKCKLLFYYRERTKCTECISLEKLMRTQVKSEIDTLKGHAFKVAVNMETFVDGIKSNPVLVEQNKFMLKYWTDVKKLYTTSLSFGAYSISSVTTLQQKCVKLQKLLERWRVVFSEQNWIQMNVDPDYYYTETSSTEFDFNLMSLNKDELKAQIIRLAEEIRGIKVFLKSKHRNFSTLYTISLCKRKKPAVELI